MITYDVPDRIAAELLVKLKYFFESVTKDNRNEDYQFVALLGLLRTYKNLLGNQDEVMTWYLQFYALGTMNEWQEDLYGLMSDRLHGFCPANKKITL